MTTISHLVIYFRKTLAYEHQDSWTKSLPSCVHGNSQLEKSVEVYQEENEQIALHVCPETVYNENRYIKNALGNMHVSHKFDTE